MKTFVSLISYSVTYCPLEYRFTRMDGLDLFRISSKFLELLLVHCFSGFRFKRDFRGKNCLCIQGNITLDGQRWLYGPDPEMSLVV